MSPILCLHVLKECFHVWGLLENLPRWAKRNPNKNLLNSKVLCLLCILLYMHVIVCKRVFASNEAVFVSIKREGCIMTDRNSGVWVTYDEGWNGVQHGAWCTLWESFTHVLYKDKQTYRLCILINQEKKQCKPKSSNVLKRPLFWSFRAMHMHAYCVCVCICAPGQWREVTITTKHTLSSALAFVLLLSASISCVWEHTPAASL